ncbi:hypothetical protein OIE40_10215 [Micropruina sp. KQZ13P-5]|nr:hypothetical protein [Micropruina sp. KQZ13P-5]MCW3158375.1 hypothetical protein [Micropruina sp. KQZ13P-5]
MYLDVVGAVAGEPVELVHDAERDRAGGDEREHVLEAVAVGGSGGLAGVDELAHDPRAEVGSLALVGFALGRDREPFLGAAALSLLPRRDTQIRHGQHRRRVRLGGGGRGGSGDAHDVLRSIGSSCFIVSPSRRLGEVGRREPVGVWLAVQVGAVAGLGDVHHPLHEPVHVGLLAPCHP